MKTFILMANLLVGCASTDLDKFTTMTSINTDMAKCPNGQYSNSKTIDVATDLKKKTQTISLSWTCPKESGRWDRQTLELHKYEF